jgi:selT/selW/selH-like putative selenoprotein
LLTDYKQRVSGLTLVPFDDGRFEVIVDGKKIYSKLETHQFPEYADVRAALERQAA